MSVTETFPVSTGKVLDVTLSCSADQLAVGDKSITCYGGSYFTYSKTPACLERGKMTWYIYLFCIKSLTIGVFLYITIDLARGSAQQSNQIKLQNIIHRRVYKATSVVTLVVTRS